MAHHDLITAVSAQILAGNNCIMKWLGNGNIQRRVKVGNDLKEIIFIQILDKRSRYDPGSYTLNYLRQEILSERGDGTLRRKGCFYKFGWSVVNVDFHHTLLIWHMATSVCYCDEFHKNGNDEKDLHQNCKRSNSLSNYFLYLLLDCPLILPEGIGEPRYVDTLSDIINFIAGRTFTTSWDVSRYLLQNDIDSRKIVWSKGMSVLEDGRKLARSLNSLEDSWSNEDKWELICEVWVEILICAAAHCGWKEHAQALTRGGELLTHVLLLMAHLGLSEQCATRDIGVGIA